MKTFVHFETMCKLKTSMYIYINGVLNMNVKLKTAVSIICNSANGANKRYSGMYTYVCKCMRECTPMYVRNYCSCNKAILNVCLTFITLHLHTRMYDNYTCTYIIMCVINTYCSRQLLLSLFQMMHPSLH